MAISYVLFGSDLTTTDYWLIYSATMNPWTIKEKKIIVVREENPWFFVYFATQSSSLRGYYTAFPYYCVALHITHIVTMAEFHERSKADRVNC